MEDRLLCKAFQVKESQRLPEFPSKQGLHQVDSVEDQELRGHETEGGTGRISGRQVFNGSDNDSL